MESQIKNKVLFVITQGEWGGAQRYIFDLLTNAPANLKMFLAVGESSGKKDLQEKIQLLNQKLPLQNRIQVIQLQHLKRNTSPLNDILAIFELKKVCATIKPNIVHLNSSKASIIGSLTKIFTNHQTNNWKLFYTVHGWVFNEPNRKIGKILYRWLEKFTANWKDTIIVLSDKEMRDGFDLGINKNKLIKIPLGIEIPTFLEKNEARQKILSMFPSSTLNTRENIWVGTIANFYKTKGLDILIEAINILNHRLQTKNCKYFIIGEGPERNNLENLIKKYNLKNQILLSGNLENASEYLKAFDVFVLPSRKEGLPYVILEALSANIPIVSTEVGGIPELISHQKTGLLSPVSPKSLANNLFQIIDDENLLKQIKQNNKQTTSLKEMLRLTFELY